MELFHEYFASGILESGIRQFGGPECFNEIPPLYHYSVSLAFLLIHLFCFYRWSSTLLSSTPIVKMAPSLFEKIYAWIGVIALIFTVYYKIAFKRGFFLLNPCHITLAFLVIFLFAKDNTSVLMRQMHTAWSGWLFGAFAALVFPHLEDISIGQSILYFVEHLLILPFGPLVLYRRYGILKPNFKNQMLAFGTIAFWQLVVLMLIGRWWQVNLNFALCHSPDEPFFPPFGYHYYTLETINLNLISYLIRYASYGYVTLFAAAYKYFVKPVKTE